MTSAAMDMPSSFPADAELPSLTDRLTVCAGLWTAANSATLARLGTLVVNDGGFFSRVGAGTSTTTKTLERFARFLIDAANWPGAEVPFDVCQFAHVVGVSGAACAASPDIAAESIGAEVPEPDAVNASAPSGRTLLRPAQDGPDEASASAVPVPAMVPQVPAGAGAADEPIPALRQAQGERKQVA